MPTPQPILPPGPLFEYRMCGLGDPPVADRLIDYATADSGSMYFVPSIEALGGIGVSPPEPA